MPKDPDLPDSPPDLGQPAAIRREPFLVSEAEAGQKLLQFLTRRLAGAVPGSALLRAIRTGQVRVDGGRKQPFFRLAVGQQVRVPPFGQAGPGGSSEGSTEGSSIPVGTVVSASVSPGAAQPTPAPLPLDIVFENADLVAVAKPAGLCAHAGTRHKDSVADRLKALYAGTPFLPVLAHRLDKDTSGILLAAKSYAELRRLGDLFALGGGGGGVKKMYLAWVDGVWPGQGTELVEDRLDRLELAEGQVAGRKKIVRGKTKEDGQDAGKLARAEVTPLVRKRQATLMLVRLLTGRTHQIRVQLSLRGHPVISDSVYGRKVRGVPMLLHALRLDLPERVLFFPPPWAGPFSVPGKILESLRS